MGRFPCPCGYRCKQTMRINPGFYTGTAENSITEQLEFLTSTRRLDGYC